MKCSKCNAELKKVEVKVHGATQKAASYQCTKCDHFEFGQIEGMKLSIK